MHPRRHPYPCKHVDPATFLDNDEVKALVARGEACTFTQDDYLGLYNCVHCNECGTSEERALLNTRFLDQGNTMPGLPEVLVNFRANGTPYQSNKMKIKRPAGIPARSDTLFFMGCLSTIKLPAFTESALRYLLGRGIDFTILDTEHCCGYPLHACGAEADFKAIVAKNVEIFTRYTRVICLCPACYVVFRDVYPATGVEFTFIADLLQPATTPRSGRVSVQHLCQLKNRSRPDVAGKVDQLLRDSGYTVEPVPMWCCGGGYGYWGRTDVIDKIATLRMQDFTGDLVTTYCSGCYWILKTFGRRCKIAPRLVPLFDLLS